VLLVLLGKHDMGWGDGTVGSLILVKLLLQVLVGLSSGSKEVPFLSFTGIQSPNDLLYSIQFTKPVVVLV